MISRSERVSSYCTSKTDLKSAIEDMAYFGYAIHMENDNQMTATAIGCRFVFEYDNADGETVKIIFKNLWIMDYSSIIYIDGHRYDTDLLLNEFGGVHFSILHD